MPLTLTPHQLRLLRLRAQRLVPSKDAPPATPAQILSSVVGVQAQELTAGLLSLRARGAGFTATQVEDARQEGRSLVWTWCMRGTLHLISAEDAGWLLGLFGPDFIAADRKRFEALGWDDALATRALGLLKATIIERGGLTRLEVVQLLEANRLPHQGQAPVHLLARAVLGGILCIGPDRGKVPTYVLYEEWLGDLRPLPRADALLLLARRYLDAYGPSSLDDMVSWSGLKRSELRQAWEKLAGQLFQIVVAEQTFWMLETQLSWLDEPSGPDPVVCLLPRYDTCLLGYKNRDWAVDPAYARRIHPGGGIIHPALLVDGRAMGTWKSGRRRSRLEVRVEPFENLPSDLLPGIEAEVADLGRFLEEEAVLIV